MSSKTGQNRKGNDAQSDVRLVSVRYVSSTPMDAPTRLRCLDRNGYVRGLKVMAMATIRDREKSALAGVSASVLGTARTRESGRRVSESVL